MLAAMTAAGDAGRTLDEAEQKAYDEKEQELDRIDAHLKRLRKLEHPTTTVTEVKSKGPTIIVKKEDPDDEFPGQSFTRRVIAKAVAHLEGYERSPAQVAKHRWPDRPTNWVGESKAAPVSTASFSTVSLTPLKTMAIAVCSNELLKHSSPAAEALIRDTLVRATAERVDTTFVSALAVSAGVSPAGMLNGLSALGSNGYDGPSVMADVLELYAPFITAKHASGLYFVMNKARAKATGLILNTLSMPMFPGLGANGGTLLGDPVVTSDNVPATVVMLIDPSNVWKIGDTGVEVSLSRDATLEQDGAPQGASDTPAAATATLVSMFQTESTAFKVTRPINFQKRRTTAVSFMDDAGWGDSSSTTT
jgi:hypothetical protein